MIVHDKFMTDEFFCILIICILIYSGHAIIFIAFLFKMMIFFRNLKSERIRLVAPYFAVKIIIIAPAEKLKYLICVIAEPVVGTRMPFSSGASASECI